MWGKVYQKQRCHGPPFLRYWQKKMRCSNTPSPSGERVNDWIFVFCSCLLILTYWCSAILYGEGHVVNVAIRGIRSPGKGWVDPPPPHTHKLTVISLWKRNWHAESLKLNIFENITWLNFMYIFVLRINLNKTQFKFWRTVYVYCPVLEMYVNSPWHADYVGRWWCKSILSSGIWEKSLTFARLIVDRENDEIVVKLSHYRWYPLGRRGLTIWHEERRQNTWTNPIGTIR